jgi:hypothetical protein
VVACGIFLEGMEAKKYIGRKIKRIYRDTTEIQEKESVAHREPPPD